MRIASLFLLTITMLATSAHGTTYKWKDCNSSQKNQIKAAVKWLKNNISKIDAKMGKNGLKKWPGKSRSKWKAKLDKKLKIRCRKADSRMCKPKEVGDGLFRTTRGKVIPILHQRRIDLCMENIKNSGVNATEDAAALASVIAHEIAHLVRLNAHRTKCKKKYEKPRFSQSVGLAVYHGYMKTTYKSSDYTRNCP